MLFSPNWLIGSAHPGCELGKVDINQEISVSQGIITPLCLEQPARRMLKIPAFIMLFFIMDVLMGGVFLVQIAFPRMVNIAGNMIDMDGERNLTTWYSSLQLFLIGFLLAGFVYHKFDRSRTEAWALLLVPAMFFFLSLDEAAQIHEKVGRYMDTMAGKHAGQRAIFDRTGGWMVVCVPMLIGAVALIAKLTWNYWRGHRRFLWLFAAGMSLLVAAAAGIEILHNWVVPLSTAAKAEVLVEETLEMIGATFMLWGVYLLLKESGIQIFGLGREAIHASRSTKATIQGGLEKMEPTA